jgi:hypothetical protein
MKNKYLELIIGIAFGILSLIAWYFPSIGIKSKLIITIITVLSSLLFVYKEKLGFFFRSYWQLLISLGLIIIVVMLFRSQFPELLVPGLIILLSTITISLLISSRYWQVFVYKTKELIKEIPFTNAWNLNHWGHNYAKIIDNILVFKSQPDSSLDDGSHIDFKGLLEIGNTYEVSCFVKAQENSTCKFQIWCHDKIAEPNGVSKATVFFTPSSSGEFVKLIFKAEFNRDVRIHLQFSPGKGEISVSDVKVFKLK